MRSDDYACHMSKHTCGKFTSASFTRNMGEYQEFYNTSFCSAGPGGRHDNEIVAGNCGIYHKA